MNVLYDISHLGYGHAHTQHKTGIFRVVEMLGRQLIASPQCHLTFCATAHSPHAYQYARKTPPFDAVPFPHSAYKFAVNARHESLHAAVGNSPAALRLPLKVARKVFYTLDQGYDLGDRPTTAQALAATDVFHATFYRIPQQVRQSKHLAKLLTVYDITPIVQPQYFDSDAGRQMAHSLDKTVRSLGEDGRALCISEATKSDLCGYLNLDPARALVTYLAADPELFYPCREPASIDAARRKYGIPEGPYVLSLCTLAPHKNIEHVIRSFARLVTEEKLDDVSLVLTGAKGWDHERIFQEVLGHSGLTGRIVLTGRVDDGDLAPLYSGALAFAYMSFYEGFGLPPLEAMQCGTPVITSDTSSLPEVVGDAGIMLDPRDEDGLCQSLLSLYRDSGLRRSMAQKSLERAKLFTWERCAQETIQAYRAAMAAKS